MVVVVIRVLLPILFPPALVEEVLPGVVLDLEVLPDLQLVVLLVLQLEVLPDLLTLFLQPLEVVEVLQPAEPNIIGVSTWLLMFAPAT